MKYLLLSFSIICSQFSWAGHITADTADHYYGRQAIAQPTDFKFVLHQVLNSLHVSRAQDFDDIVDHCDLQDPHCYGHVSHGYKTARKYLFGQLHLEGQSHNYHITTYYCLSEVDNGMLPSHQSLGPHKIPSSNVVNTEHSWPQSRFTTAFPKGLQKSDLHALFPVAMKVNSTRGNHPYGEVELIRNRPCNQAALGDNKHGQLVFEPAEDVKGDVARATFYFSTRYNLPIDSIQEEVLRGWHEQDPVDFEELSRNEDIFLIQHVRNPYIDHPEWVSLVQDF